jgi:hypothetical protein
MSCLCLLEMTTMPRMMVETSILVEQAEMIAFTMSETPVVNIFNNNDTMPLSPVSVGVDAMQPPERPSLSPVSASTTNKKSKDANQRSSQEISFVPVEEDDLTGTLCD